VRLAAEAGLRTLAVTDHDTVAGVAEALEAGRELGVEVVPGIELSTTVERGEIHMLGLWVDHTDPGLLEMTSKMQGGRDAAARQMVENLRGMGLDRLSFERVRELAGEASIGRPAIAQAMLEQGYIERFADAFTEQYIASNGQAYVPRHKLLPTDAVRLVHRAGGVAVLAHPTYTHDLHRELARLKRAGLDGLEVYYTNYSPAVRGRLLRLARIFGLLPGGGSDYHGVPSMGNPPLGSHYVPQFVLEGLRRRQERRGTTAAMAGLP
jgi:predicted metal-dependent phosphoesterase TrpH